LAKKSRPAVSLTTAQRLGSLVKCARDIMRKDKGLNGDLDRLPLLTWLLFLKFLDDHEQVREERAKLKREKYRPVIEPPYRWRDWAAKEDGISGDALKHFINQDEVTRPDGSKQPGLLAYLRGLQSSNGDDRRDVVASVFAGVTNRMESGYLLRDVINKVNGIHFDSTEEIHTLGHLYESMLKEMRDAAGDSGEFYTPRPLVRFMVEVVNPRLGETVLDPACGTGGFLVESFQHLEKQCRTVQDRRVLQQASILGNEAKPLPYMLAQMNLLLHGLESPQIMKGNSLAQKLTHITEADRVDVILTNPPFGGEEERGILGNFPEDKQTAETALLFLQLIMRKLRATPKPGRAAVVVPNGTLFGDGVCARIKQELLTKFNLHTIVRLPNGVFAPYTSIPTNVLFFDRTGPTTEIWYYEQPLPEGRKQYTKTFPIQFEEFGDCVQWWADRKENERAWRVPAETIRTNNCNLDRKEPARQTGFGAPAARAAGRGHPPEGAADRGDHAGDQGTPGDEAMSRWPMVTLGEVLAKSEEWVPIHPGQWYKEVTVRLWGKGAVLRRELLGAQIAASNRLKVHADDFIISRIDARNGASALIPADLDGAVVSNDFPVFKPVPDRLWPKYLGWIGKTRHFIDLCKAASEGTTNRVRLKENRFLATVIPLPPLADQRRLVERIDALATKVEEARQLRSTVDQQTEAFTHSLLNQVYEAQSAVWGVAALGEVCSGITDGTHLTPSFVEKGVKFIFVGNVSSGHLHFNACKYVSPEYYGKVAPSRQPRRGDVLYSAVGATLGMPALVDCDEPFCFQRHVAIIRPDPRRRDSRYLWFMLRSGTLFKRAWSSITGTAQPTVPLKAIRVLPIPVPTVREQQRIVGYLENVQSNGDTLSRCQLETSTELNAMLPAILHQAFHGEP
jgi:type I restriction enzyme M protein